jgi:hypothetical protein
MSEIGKAACLEYLSLPPDAERWAAQNPYVTKAASYFPFFGAPQMDSERSLLGKSSSRRRRSVFSLVQPASGELAVQTTGGECLAV